MEKNRDYNVFGTWDPRRKTKGIRTMTPEDKVSLFIEKKKLRAVSC